MKQAAQRISRLLPAGFRRTLKRIAYSGSERYCPLCQCSFRAFQTAGVSPRVDAQCPECGSLERHRMLWWYLERKTDFFEVSGVRMLHFAAERCFEKRFRSQIGAGYTTADLFNRADVTMDIIDIQFPDNSFDIVYCSHVLEHVPNDRLAMRELCRVLKPEGWAIIMVPVTAEHTIEDPNVTDPQDRLRLYGQEDHVRRYGPDFIERLHDAGFRVNVSSPDDFLTPEEIVKIAARREFTGDIYYCAKRSQVTSQ